MKKIIKMLILIAALTTFAAMAIASGSSESDGKEIVTSEKDTTHKDNSSKESTSNDGKEDIAVTIEEQVLLDRDGIKVTAKEYVTDSIWGEGIKVLVENTTDKNVGVSCDTLIVNNYMVSNLFSASVAAGKKANDTLYLSSSELEAAGIENVGQIEVYFRVYDSDSYRTIFDADVATIQTSIFADMDITPADSGAELYNQDGIRIVGKLVDEDSFWGTAVLLYLENNSGQNVTVSCEDMSVNGFMVTPLFYSTIFDGKMALDEITILSSDLEKNDITSIEEIELSFHIYNPDTYKTIADTDPITFSAQ